MKKVKLDFEYLQWTPFHYAAWLGGDLDKLKTILDSGEDINAKDGDEKTPLHLAVAENNRPPAKRV